MRNSTKSLLFSDFKLDLSGVICSWLRGTKSLGTRSLDTVNRGHFFCTQYLFFLCTNAWDLDLKTSDSTEISYWVSWHFWSLVCGQFIFWYLCSSTLVAPSTILNSGQLGREHQTWPLAGVVCGRPEFNSSKGLINGRLVCLCHQQVLFEVVPSSIPQQLL